jgi:hypothetical protein
LQQPKAQSDFLEHPEAAGRLGLGKQALLQGATQRDVTFGDIENCRTGRLGTL